MTVSAPILRFDARMGDPEHQIRGQAEFRDGHIFSFLATGEPVASVLASSSPLQHDAPSHSDTSSTIQRGQRYDVEVGAHVTRAFPLPGVGIIMQWRPPKQPQRVHQQPSPHNVETKEDSAPSLQSSPDGYTKQRQRTPTNITTRASLRSRRANSATKSNGKGSASRHTRASTTSKRSRGKRQSPVVANGREDSRVWRRATPINTSQTAAAATPKEKEAISPTQTSMEMADSTCYWYTLQHPLDEPQPVLSCAPSRDHLPTSYYTLPGEPMRMSFDRHPHDMLVHTSEDPDVRLFMTYNQVNHVHTIWEWGPLHGMARADVVTQMIVAEGWESAMAYLSTQESRVVARPIQKLEMETVLL